VTHVEARVRAGMLEQGTVELLHEAGMGACLGRVGLVHDGVEIAFNERMVSIDIKALIGGTMTAYGQTELTKNLGDAMAAANTRVFYDAEDVAIARFDSQRPHVTINHRGIAEELHCDFVAGCDGFHGVSRRSVAPVSIALHEHVYPFGWLGVLSETPPVSHELIYANHEQGFALCGMRSLTRSRYYWNTSRPGARLSSKSVHSVRWRDYGRRRDSHGGSRP
jgi:p-hydroxybenzoate 3-monooxygenase